MECEPFECPECHRKWTSLDQISQSIKHGELLYRRHYAVRRAVIIEFVHVGIPQENLCHSILRLHLYTDQFNHQGDFLKVSFHQG